MQNITIKELISKKILENKYVIPAIQRKYVWKEKDICKYFDSIMREYPTGHIMLWGLTGKYINKGEITFYKFLDDYVENRLEYNKPISHVADGDYFAVLDGQQRIQSLIIALSGKYINKNNVKKELYINILKEKKKNDEFDAYDEDSDDEYYKGEYEFKFFKEKDINELKDIKEGKLWFKVKEILNIENNRDITSKLNKYKKNSNEEKNESSIKLSDEQIDYAREILDDLNYKINKSTEVLKIDYLKNTFNLNEILEIFVRVNSGGEKLSKPDLLFSTVVSNWDKGRETIDEFIKEINAPSTFLNYKFDSDFIMRTFLFIKKNDTTMKIENFKTIADGIEEDWIHISEAIKKVVRYIRDMGFKHDFITSYNSIIPLVYYAYNNSKKRFSSKDLKEMKKYLYISQLNHLFGTASNQVLNQCKQVLIDKSVFKLKYFYKVNFTGSNSFKVTFDNLNKWLNFEKDTKEASIVLKVLYPNLNYGADSFQKDHVHPLAQIKQYIKNNKGCDFLKNCNRIPNLELLRGHVNVVEKHEIPLKEWIKKHKVDYISKSTTPLEIENFNEFYNYRKKKMLSYLCKIFNVPHKK